MRQRFDAGSLLVAAAAVALLVALPLDWFSPGLSAWGAFEVVDVLLAALAVAALVGALREPSAADDGVRWLPVACAAALVLVASQAVDAPPGAGPHREIGLWLALGATLLMTLGASLMAARISVVVDVQGRDHRKRVAAVDKRDAVPVAVDPSELVTAPLAPGVPVDATQPFAPVPDGGAEPAQGS